MHSTFCMRRSTVSTSRSVASWAQCSGSFHALRLLHAEIDSLDIPIGGIMGPTLRVLPFPWLRISEGLRLHMLRCIVGHVGRVLHHMGSTFVACGQQEIMHRESFVESFSLVCRPTLFAALDEAPSDPCNSNPDIRSLYLTIGIDQRTSVASLHIVHLQV